jgi:hypothetical protein
MQLEYSAYVTITAESGEDMEMIVDAIDGSDIFAGPLGTATLSIDEGEPYRHDED